MSQERSTAQTTGGIDQAISNLDAIKSGEDPRTNDEAGIVVTELPSKRVVEDNRHSPAYSRDRVDAHDRFLLLLNLTKPDHPYNDDPYPVLVSDMETSYHRKDSSTWASCGPRRWERGNDVFFAVDMDMFEDARPGFLLMVLAHEVMHVPYGSHSESSGHRPKFWRAMADTVVDVIEHRDELVEPTVDHEEFVTNLVQQAYCDPNWSTVDRRSMTVDEQREAVLDRISSECRRRDLDVAVEISR